MYISIRIISFILALPLNVTSQRILAGITSKKVDNSSSISNYLKDIYREKPFDSLLVLHQSNILDTRIQMILSFDAPKVIATKDIHLQFKVLFNSEILSIVIMFWKLDEILLATLAQTLHHMRHARILAIAMDVFDPEKFRQSFLILCERFYMTNVLLLFVSSAYEIKLEFDVIKPYPDYHWHFNESFPQGSQYFACQWKDLKNKTLVTFPDSALGRNFLYTDANGATQVTGFMAQLVFLFAEVFNASLEMYQPLHTNSYVHNTAITQMTIDGKLDIPMALELMHPGNLSITYMVDISSSFLVVPCASPIAAREIFFYVFCSVYFITLFISVLIFSIAIYAIERIFNGTYHKWYCLFSDKALLGVLGQSFRLPTCPWKGLKVLCLFIGFVGVERTTQLTAFLNTQLTSPSTLMQIKTFDDLVRSPLKILMAAQELPVMGDVMKPFASSCIISDNTTYVGVHRENFNTTYGYFTRTTAWYFYQRQQEFFTRKSFCTDSRLILFPIMHLGMPLQENSPYAEAMNDLILRVHDIGLMRIWMSNTFIDMWKTKKLSTHDPKPEEGKKVLNEQDLFWVWSLVVLGLSLSSLVFLVEVGIKEFTERKRLRI